MGGLGEWVQEFIFIRYEGRPRTKIHMIPHDPTSDTKRTHSKGFALTWYRALTWYSSPARPFAAPDDPRLVTGQQGRPSPACQQLFRARNVCAGGSSEGSTKLTHGTKFGRPLAT